MSSGGQRRWTRPRRLLPTVPSSSLDTRHLAKLPSDGLNWAASVCGSPTWGTWGLGAGEEAGASTDPRLREQHILPGFCSEPAWVPGAKTLIFSPNHLRWASSCYLIKPLLEGEARQPTAQGAGRQSPLPLPQRPRPSRCGLSSDQEADWSDAEAPRTLGQSFALSSALPVQAASPCFPTRVHSLDNCTGQPHGETPGPARPAPGRAARQPVSARPVGSDESPEGCCP